MKLYYYQAPAGNFGDDLNPWLWYKLRPDLFYDDDNTLFIGIGTLINHRLPKDKKKIIFGSGVGYGDTPAIDNTYDIICVRGPLSASALNISKEKVVTDSAMLINSLNIELDKQPNKISFMTHCDNTINADWERICQLSGLQYIDIHESVDSILKKLSSTKLLITEAMHGAIIADALRIPWIPINLYNTVLSFKWTDWCETINIAYSPILFPQYWTIESSLPFQQKQKNKTKRLLKAVGFSDKNWTQPYPKNSSKHIEENIIKKLITLSSGDHALMSSDSTLDSLVSNLEERLEKIKI